MTPERIKTPCEIINSFGFRNNPFSRDESAVILDTGAIIDMVHSVRSYERVCKGRKLQKEDYITVRSMLDCINSNSRIVVLPLVYGESIKHSSYKLNGHQLEIDPDTFSLVENIASDSFDYISFLSSSHLPLLFEDIRYDVYNTTLESCLDCAKKHEEGFSKVDKDILLYSGILSRVPILLAGDKVDLQRVYVLSPDRHILCGTQFMINEFGEKYNKIIPISTRTGGKNGF